MAGAKRSGGTIAAINGVPPSGAPATSTGVSWSRRMLVLDGYQAQDNKTCDIIIYHNTLGRIYSNLKLATGLDSVKKLGPLIIKAPADFTHQCLETKLQKW